MILHREVPSKSGFDGIHINGTFSKRTADFTTSLGKFWEIPVSKSQILGELKFSWKYMADSLEDQKLLIYSCSFSRNFKMDESIQLPEMQEIIVSPPTMRLSNIPRQ